MSKITDTQVNVTVLPSTVVAAPSGVPAVLVPDPLQPAQSTHLNGGKSVNITVGSSVIVNPA